MGNGAVVGCPNQAGYFQVVFQEHGDSGADAVVEHVGADPHLGEQVEGSDMQEREFGDFVFLPVFDNEYAAVERKPCTGRFDDEAHLLMVFGIVACYFFGQGTYGVKTFDIALALDGKFLLRSGDGSVDPTVDVPDVFARRFPFVGSGPFER